MPLASLYLLALCDTAQSSNFSFGVASRLGTQSSTFNIDTAKLIHSIVKFSPASESVAIEFLHEFHKVPGITHLGNFVFMQELISGLMETVSPVVSLQSELEPQQWAE